MSSFSEREILEFRRDGPPPDFSICVPQYNRTSYLLKAIQGYSEQSHRNIEICISDGASTDCRQAEVRDALRAAGLPFAFYASPVNLRYDANLRSAIALARGRYCVLMGNDDALAEPDTLARLWADIRAQNHPGVVISDYCDYEKGRPAQAIRATKNYGAGPRVAAFHFRNYSFISGIAIDRQEALSFATDKWDGSEMYQMYLGSRIVASGRDLLERTVVTVRKDISVPGEQIDSYARRPLVWPCPIVERPLPLGQLARVVADAIAPYAGPDVRRWNEAILDQLLGITYPFWLTEYRKVQSWRYAAGVGLGMRPTRTADGLPLGWFRRARVWAIYWTATAAGLTVPQGLFARIKRRLHRLVKSPR